VIIVIDNLAILGKYELHFVASVASRDAFVPTDWAAQIRRACLAHIVGATTADSMLARASH
jgi:hypothetical protein